MDIKDKKRSLNKNLIANRIFKNINPILDGINHVKRLIDLFTVVRLVFVPGSKAWVHIT